MRTPEASYIDPSAPALLNDLFADVNALAISLKKISFGLHHQDHLPPGGRVVLGILKKGDDLTVPQIARLHRSSRQNIQVLVDRLARLNLVVFADNPAHKRSPIARLTPAGRWLLEKVSERESAAHADLYSELGEADLNLTIRTLRKLREHLEITRARMPRTPAPTLKAGHEPRSGKEAEQAYDEIPLSLL